jgi:hypothetical protein
MEEKKETKSALQELTGKSWNLELIISGAAIFLTAMLPDMIEQGFHYFIDHLATDSDYDMMMFPLLAYSFFKVVAWLLTTAFILHLVMRAFWVSMIGLQAAFPAGIRYEHIPSMSAAMREYMAEWLGELEPYIIRLDRRCNQIFALAFLIALMSIGIAFVYLICFSIFMLLRGFLSPDAMQIVRNVLFTLFILFAIGIGLANQMIIKNEQYQARYGRKFIVFSIKANEMIMPLVMRPLNYLSLTFSSNVPKKRYYIVLIGTMTAFFICVIFVLTAQLSDLRSSRHFELRNFFSEGSSRYELMGKKYDNLRYEGARMATVSLPSEMVESPFLPVFVAYPKSLDLRLSAFCVPPNKPDSLSKEALRTHLDSLKMQCLAQYFRLWVNDSLIAQPDWMFQEKPGTGMKGLVSYLPTKNMKEGKNVIKVWIPSETKRDSLEEYGAVPFWLAK